MLVSGTASVVQAVTLADNLVVDLASSLAGTVSIGGGYSNAGSGITLTDAGVLSVNSNLKVDGTASVVQAVTLANNLEVGGTAVVDLASSLAGTVSIGGGCVCNLLLTRQLPFSF